MGRTRRSGGRLAPRYIVGSLPEGAQPHIGTTDVDLVIGLAVGDESPEAYRTLANNLKSADFRAEQSFQWKRTVEGVTVTVEFLCETDQVEPGKIFRPREGTGSALGAFNVRGAQLVTRDYMECSIEAERLDEGRRSWITVRVAGILPYVVLKILAFQDRHENKDAYDLVYTLLNYGEGPEDAGAHAAVAPSQPMSRFKPRCNSLPSDLRRPTKMDHTHMRDFSTTVTPTSSRVTDKKPFRSSASSSPRFGHSWL